MTPQLWEHWLMCHTPLSQCPRCQNVRRAIRAAKRRCPIQLVIESKELLCPNPPTSSVDAE